MNPLDLIALVGVALGAGRGRARGLAAEAYPLLRIAAAVAAGVGLRRLIARGIRAALSVGGEVSGAIAFAGSFAGAWWLTRRLKRWMTAFLAARAGRYNRIGGAIAGAVRVFLWILAIEGLLQLAGKPEGAPGGGFSLVGRLAALIVARR